MTLYEFLTFEFAISDLNYLPPIQKSVISVIRQKHFTTIFWYLETFFFRFLRILTSIEFEVIINILSHFTFHFPFILSYISLILLLLFFPEKSFIFISLITFIFFLFTDFFSVIISFELDSTFLIF